MNSESEHQGSKGFFKRRGAPLMLTGIILVIVFGLFIWIGRDPGEGYATPMWIGVFLGLGMAGYGLYRALEGPGMLDFPHGGTNSDPD